MRRFWASVAAHTRKIKTLLAVAILFTAQQLFEDQLVMFVKWAATRTGMTPTAALLFAVQNPLVAFFGAIGLTLIGIFLLAWRDVRRAPPPLRLPPPQPPQLPPLVVTPPPPKPVAQPPIIEYVTSEANVRLYPSPYRYSRTPSQDLTRPAKNVKYGILVAFRHRGGALTDVTARLRFRPVVAGEAGGNVILDEGIIHVHSAAWIDASGSATFSYPKTHELILAVKADYDSNAYDALDVSGAGITYKDVPNGAYVIEVELEITGGNPLRFDFDVILAPHRDDMRVSLGTLMLGRI